MRQGFLFVQMAAIVVVAYMGLVTVNRRIANHQTDHGRHIFSIAFSQQNGELVDIDPPVFPTLHGAPVGNFYVSPGKTTTYTLTVTGKKGRQDRRQLTVEVPAN